MSFPNPTPGRNALFQLDVLHCILDHLAAPEDLPAQVRETRRALYALAQTCRALSDPCLDRLWSKLDSLEPLIRCCAKLWSLERAMMSLSPTEWAIICRYSCRIRELKIDPLDLPSYYFLQSISPCPSLLVPNLRVLQWHPGDFLQPRPSVSIMLAKQLLSPSLVSLDVSLSDVDEVKFQSFLDNFRLCPDLKAFSIYVAGYLHISQMTIKSLSQVIPLDEHLECLHVHIPIDDFALRHITLSRKLKELTLVLHPEKSGIHQVRLRSSDVPFYNVEMLTLEIWDLRFVTSLLRTEGQMFRTLALRYHSQPSTEAVSAFLDALASPQRIRVLQSVMFLPDPTDLPRAHHPFAEPNEIEVVTYSSVAYRALRPLASLSQLRKLVIDFGHWISIDDNDLVSLAQNWPQLQFLSLNCCRFANGYPWTLFKYISFRGLLHLLEHCPDLHDLFLPLDAREVPTDTPEGLICNPSLTWFSVLDSPINDAYSVAQFLDRHFPSVTRVCPMFGSPFMVHEDLVFYGTEWMRVNWHLERFRSRPEGLVTEAPAQVPVGRSWLRRLRRRARSLLRFFCRRNS